MTPRAKSDLALGWWTAAAAKITGLQVASAEIGDGPTTLRTRRRFRSTEDVVLLAVAKYELSELAHSDAGRWVIAQQYLLATADRPRLAHWARRIQFALAVAAVGSLLAATQAGSSAWAFLIGAVIATAGWAWIARERYRDRVLQVCRADAAATSRYGPAAARAALNARPQIYRSAFHELFERRSRISITGRLTQLSADSQ